MRLVALLVAASLVSGAGGEGVPDSAGSSSRVGMPHIRREGVRRSQWHLSPKEIQHYDRQHRHGGGAATPTSPAAKLRFTATSAKLGAGFSHYKAETCNTDADCKAPSRCHKPLGLQHRRRWEPPEPTGNCLRKNLEGGEQCWLSSECKSGKCHGSDLTLNLGKCLHVPSTVTIDSECVVSADCMDKNVCVAGASVCRKLSNTDGACSRDSECDSNTCRSGQCQPPAAKTHSVASYVFREIVPKLVAPSVDMNKANCIPKNEFLFKARQTFSRVLKKMSSTVRSMLGMAKSGGGGGGGGGDDAANAPTLNEEHMSACRVFSTKDQCERNSKWMVQCRWEADTAKVQKLMETAEAATMEQWHSNRRAQIASSLATTQVDTQQYSSCRIYKVRAKHHRIKPIRSSFYGSLQAARVDLPGIRLTVPLNIRTPIGNIWNFDHIIFSVEEYNAHLERYKDAFPGGLPKAKRVQLITPARSNGLLFASVAMFVGYSDDSMENPDTYVLEAGTVAGTMEMLYPAMEFASRKAFVSYKGYTPTPFSHFRDHYLGIAYGFVNDEPVLKKTPSFDGGGDTEQSVLIKSFSRRYSRSSRVEEQEHDFTLFLAMSKVDSRKPEPSTDVFKRIMHAVVRIESIKHVWGQECVDVMNLNTISADRLLHEKLNSYGLGKLGWKEKPTMPSGGEVRTEIMSPCLSKAAAGLTLRCKTLEKANSCGRCEELPYCKVGPAKQSYFSRKSSKDPSGCTCTYEMSDSELAKWQTGLQACQAVYEHDVTQDLLNGKTGKHDHRLGMGHYKKDSFSMARHRVRIDCAEATRQAVASEKLYFNPVTPDQRAAQNFEDKLPPDSAAHAALEALEEPK